MSKEIRLLLVNTVRTTQNGQTMFLLNYLRHMDRSGMKIGFVAANAVEGWVRDELDRMGVALYELPMRNRHPLQYMRALQGVIRKGDYQIIHAHGNSATLATEMVAAARAGVPVRIAHSHNTRCNHILVHKLLTPLLLRCATARFACGQEAGRWLFGGRKFTVIRNASDAGVYGFDGSRRQRMREQMGLTGQTVIGTVGSLNAQKNPLFLLRAFAKARTQNENLHLLMVGDGPLRPQVERFVADNGLTNCVTLTGRINDVPDRLQAMDMMALPSVHEGFPCVLVEWQLNGLPALVSDAVTRDCDLTGMLRYMPLDEAVWAEAMAKTVLMQDRAQISRENGQKVAAAGYDIHTEAAQIKRGYQELLEAKRK